MIDLALAVRNLLRNRRRSLATLLALVIGTTSILFFSGYRTNIEYTMLTAYVRDGGHLQVQHRDLLHYGAGDPVRYSIPDYEKIIAAILQDEVLGELVNVVTPTLQFGGIASNSAEGVSRTVIGLGQVAVERNRMRAWNESGLPMPEVPFLLDGAAADSTVIGTGVARVLLLCEALHVADCPPRAQRPQAGGATLPDDVARLALGEVQGAPRSAGKGPRIDVIASSAGGAPNVVSLAVLRAERQGFRELDEVYLTLHLPQAQRLVYGSGRPMVTAIMLQLTRTDRMAAAKKRLEAVIAKAAPDQALAVLDFRQMNPFFVQTMQMFDMIFGFIFVLIGSIVLFTVGNTMSTAVAERTVEIGTIRALGVRRGGVRRLFVLEGTLLGVAGAVIGVLLALAGSGAVNRMGLSWLPPGSGERLPLLLVIWGENLTVLLTAAGLVVIAGVSAWWPAHRASRLVIVDALRHV